MLDTDNYQICLILPTETDCENFCHRNRNRFKNFLPPKPKTETETESQPPKPKPIQKLFATETETETESLPPKPKPIQKNFAT